MVIHTAILQGLPTPHVHLWACGRWCLQQTKASSVIGPVLRKLHVQSTYVLHVQSTYVPELCFDMFYESRLCMTACAVHAKEVCVSSCMECNACRGQKMKTWTWTWMRSPCALCATISGMMLGNCLYTLPPAFGTAAQTA